MIARSFYKKLAPYRLADIVKLLDIEPAVCPYEYDDLLIYDVKSLEDANFSDISFLSNHKYINQFQSTKACCCIVPNDFSLECNDKIILLKVKNPYLAYAKLIDLFYTKAKSYPNKVMKSAYISDSATIGDNCYIGHNVVIEDNVVIGNNCIIESGTAIDYGVKLGNEVFIHSNVSISYSIVGNNVIILSGARIGQDGFGFATDKDIHKKIFHTGIVRIGNEVEIGSNTTIDRGSVSDTVIEDLCKIDNLVQIGHNVVIGKGTIIAAQSGISGSTKIGKYCIIGGQVGISGHIIIGDKAQVAAQSGVVKNIDQGVAVGGYPAIPIREWHKQSIIMKNLQIRERNDN